MSIIEEAFLTRCKSGSGLGPAGTRLYPQFVPEAAVRPAAAYSTRDRQNPGESLGDEGGYCHKVFQIDIWSDTKTAYQDVKDVEEAVRNRFGLKAANVGTWSITGGGSIWVFKVSVEDNQDDIVPPAFAEGQAIQMVSLNVTIIFEQALPTGS